MSIDITTTMWIPGTPVEAATDTGYAAPNHRATTPLLPTGKATGLRVLRGSLR